MVRDWYWRVAEWAGFGTMVVGVFVVTFVLTFGVGVLTCDQLEEATGIETRFTFLNGCLLKQGEHWIPEKRWRVMD